MDEKSEPTPAIDGADAADAGVDEKNDAFEPESPVASPRVNNNGSEETSVMLEPKESMALRAELKANLQKQTALADEWEGKCRALEKQNDMLSSTSSMGLGQRVKELEAEVDRKSQELVKQGEKNFVLVDLIKKAKVRQHGAWWD